MGQVSSEFSDIKLRLDEQDRKYDRLITTIDGFISRIEGTRLNWLLVKFGPVD